MPGYRVAILHTIVINCTSHNCIVAQQNVSLSASNIYLSNDKEIQHRGAQFWCDLYPLKPNLKSNFMKMESLLTHLTNLFKKWIHFNFHIWLLISILFATSHFFIASKHAVQFINIFQAEHQHHIDDVEALKAHKNSIHQIWYTTHKGDIWHYEFIPFMCICGKAEAGREPARPPITSQNRHQWQHDIN